jgi:hypothetical protein
LEAGLNCANLVSPNSLISEANPKCSLTRANS